MDSGLRLLRLLMENNPLQNIERRNITYLRHINEMLELCIVRKKGQGRIVFMENSRIQKKITLQYIHNIHNRLLQPFRQYYALASHTTSVVCLNGTFIYSLSFCQKSAERKSPKKYFHIFVLMSNSALTSNTTY